jgi:Tol biopolymer transport system component
MTGGALWPDVSPDGRTIAFVGYTASGYDVFTTTVRVPRPTRAIIAASIWARSLVR